LLGRSVSVTTLTRPFASLSRSLASTALAFASNYTIRIERAVLGFLAGVTPAAALLMPISVALILWWITLRIFAIRLTCPR